MGLLRELTEEFSATSPDEARLLRGLISCMIGVDGSVAAGERALVATLEATVPQLRDNPNPTMPPQASRTRMLEELSAISNDALRRQCFVLAAELALSSGGVDDREDAYLDQIRAALRLDEAFCRQAVTLLACKYACAR